MSSNNNGFKTLNKKRINRGLCCFGLLAIPLAFQLHMSSCHDLKVSLFKNLLIDASTNQSLFKQGDSATFANLLRYPSYIKYVDNDGVFTVITNGVPCDYEKLVLPTLSEIEKAKSLSKIEIVSNNSSVLLRKDKAKFSQWAQSACYGWGRSTTVGKTIIKFYF